MCSSDLPQKTVAAPSRSRSGSMEAPLSRTSAAMGNFKTPRSRSRTPNSTRKPLSALAVNTNSARASLADGKRSSVYGAPGGLKKDSRPIGDKDWQREVIRELVDFLNGHGFVKELVLKDFYPVNTSTFR